ncbi:hypothetical protein PILCRDRAFT_290963 [Piloderma croceum F 1598]|uniref:Uncharacterized protein n=1 Tax=Piloderma croceum (strain F 1598) TaxID=765440 RepID=A0A0C3G4X6_PILCF|nr:hypothetical protein PILCRDRAFT_290963 [Piloderma croceum F 1598]
MTFVKTYSGRTPSRCSNSRPTRAFAQLYSTHLDPLHHIRSEENWRDPLYDGGWLLCHNPLRWLAYWFVHP